MNVPPIDRQTAAVLDIYAGALAWGGLATGERGRSSAILRGMCAAD